MRFAAVRLLKHGPVEQTERRRLRDLLLLALRVVALLLLAIAFARPFFASAQGQSSAVTIIALDTSMSLSAPGRFERAKALAKEAIRNVPPAEALGVLTFSDETHVVTGVSGDGRLPLRPWMWRRPILCDAVSHGAAGRRSVDGRRNHRGGH